MNNLLTIAFDHLVRAGIEQDFNALCLERMMNYRSCIGVLTRKELALTLQNRDLRA